MSSNAVRAAQHRRSLRIGISISAAAHVAALAVLTVPGGEAPAGTDAATHPARAFPALEVVELRLEQEVVPEPIPNPTLSAIAAAPVAARSAEAGPEAATGATASAAATSLDALLGSMTAARPAQASADRSKPISPFKRLEAVAGTGRVGADGTGSSEQEGDDERSLWREILDGITISVGAGPYCPVRGGPLIMR